MQLVYCPSGHKLHQMTAKMLANPPRSSYSAGARCDVCGTTITDRGAVFHCDICSYDLCQKCFDHTDKAMKCCCCGSKAVMDRWTPDDFRSLNNTDPSQRCDLCQQECKDQFMIVCRVCQKKTCAACCKSKAVCFKFLTK